MKELVRLLHVMRPVTGWLILGGLLSLITLLANVGLMAMSGWFIAAMAGAGIAGISINYFTPAAVIRVCAIVRTAGRYGERLIAHEATLRLLSELRVWCYERLEPLAPSGLETYRSGDLLSRLRADIDTLDHFYLQLLLPFMVALFAALAFVLFLFWFNPRLALIEGGMLLLAGIVLPLIINRLTADKGERINSLNADLRAALVNDLQGMGELLVDGADTRHADRISRLSYELAATQTSMSRLNGISQGSVGLIAHLTMWLIILSAIPMIHSGALPATLLAMLTLFTLATFEAIAPLPAAFLWLGETLSAAKRVFQLVDTEPVISEPQRPVPMPDDLTIALDSICFSYQEDRSLAVDSISLMLPPGKKLAVIGPSGSGKTTLLQLILKFRTPDSGQITFGGVPLESLSGEMLRNKISVVSQYSHLFNTSIRENMLLANPAADNTAIEAACRQAMIHDFIVAQPDGYETQVGEIGIRLSGGQARRIAVARALLKKAPILILDEPAEGLDPRTEHLMMRNIMQWLEEENRSLLLITHRLRGLEVMDEILLLHEGCIIERGSHKSLKASSKTYNRLLENQLFLDPQESS